MFSRILPSFIIVLKFDLLYSHSEILVGITDILRSDTFTGIYIYVKNFDFTSAVLYILPIIIFKVFYIYQV